MRYLKRFNESTEYNFEFFLNKFTQETFEYLAFLYDEGADINIESNTDYIKQIKPDMVKDGEIIYIEILIPKIKWEDLKDYIIPYFEFINSEYSFIEGNDFGLIGIINIPPNEEGYNKGSISFDREKPIDIINNNLYFNKGSVEENPITKISFNIKL